MAIGGLFTAVFLVGIQYPINNMIWDIALIFITGLVISARMIVSDHSRQELIVGLIIGVLTQTVAYLWVG